MAHFEVRGRQTLFWLPKKTQPGDRAPDTNIAALGHVDPNAVAGCKERKCLSVLPSSACQNEPMLARFFLVAVLVFSDAAM